MPTLALSIQIPRRRVAPAPTLAATLTATLTATLAVSALACVALAVSAAPARAQAPVTLNFESLSTASGCDDNTFTTYGGLAWAGWGAMHKVECGAADVFGPRNGYWYGATSGIRTAYIQLPAFSDPFGGLHADIAMGGGTFDLLDAWLTAAWTTGLDVSIDGYSGATLIGTRTFKLDYTAPTHGAIGLLGLTRAHFRTSGGTPHFELGGLGNILVMDDLTVRRHEAAVIPEPATLLLVTSGLAVLGVATRRRRR